MGVLSLEGFLYSAPLIVPVDFKPSMHFRHLEKELFSTKVTTVLIRTFTDIESFTDHHTLIDVHSSLQAVRKNVTHFSMNTFDAMLNNLLSLKNAFALMGSQGQEQCQQLYTAVYLRAVLELCKKSDEVFIEAIAMLEKNGNYWDEQYAHPYYYFFHRSPLKWSKKTSYKVEIMTNKKCISDVQHQYEVALGENALLCAEFNDHASGDELFAWIKRLCVDLSKLCLKSPLKPEFITQENCGHIIKQLYAALNKQDKRIQEQVRGATMPSHFEHNWALCTGLIVAAIGGYVYMHKNPGVIQKSFQRVQDFFVKNYTNHLREPLRGIKKELFIDKNDSVSMAQELNKLVEKSTPSKEMEKELIEDTYKFYIDIDKSLGMHCDLEELRLKSEALDRGYFLRFLHRIFSEKWPEGGVVVQSWMNPFAKTTKSKIFDEIPGGITLLARLTEHQGISMLKVGFNKIDESEKKVNLTLAMVSLLPAYFVMSKAVSGIRSFGGFLLPKGYDDTPIKNYIIKMQDLLDDILYIDSLKTYDTLDARSVGKLLYYGAQLDDEIKHLSQKNRIALEALLEKFSITNDLKGKHLYLEKMLREYESWTRFIQR